MSHFPLMRKCASVCVRGHEPLLGSLQPNLAERMTVRADIYDGTQPATVMGQISPTLDDIRSQLPYGYIVEVGGTVEDLRPGTVTGTSSSA